MTKAQKRTHSEMMELSQNSPFLPCTPHHISFLEPPSSPTEQHVAKRVKRFETSDAFDSSFAAASGSTESSFTRSPRPSNFPKFNFDMQNIPTSKWVEWTPRHRRKHHTIKASFSRPTNEAVFTLDDVKALLQSAISEYETHMTQKYDNILTERLSEQFNNFQKFNEDHVHRLLKDSQYDYYS